MAPPLTGFVDFSDLASARHCPEQPERRTVLQNGREKLFPSTGRPDGNQTRAICFPFTRQDEPAAADRSNRHG